MLTCIGEKVGGKDWDEGSALGWALFSPHLVILRSMCGTRMHCVPYAPPVNDSDEANIKLSTDLIVGALSLI